MEAATGSLLARNTNFSPAAQTPKSESPAVADASHAAHSALGEEEAERHCRPAANGENITGPGEIQEKTRDVSKEDGSHKDEGAGFETEGKIVSLDNEYLSSRFESRSSAEKSKPARITLGDMPLIINEDDNFDKATHQEAAKMADRPLAASSSNAIQKKGTNMERLRFRSTLATVINDSKGIFGEWNAKENVATAAAKELLQTLAERVEHLVNEATAVTMRLTTRKKTLEKDEVQCRLSSRKMSSAFFATHNQDFPLVEGRQKYKKESRNETENLLDRKGEGETQVVREESFWNSAEGDTAVLQAAAVEAVKNLVETAVTKAKETVYLPERKGRQGQERAECGDLDGGELPSDRPASDGYVERQISATEDASFVCEQQRCRKSSFISQSSLESYDVNNFPQDVSTCLYSKSPMRADCFETSEVENGSCQSVACENSQLRRDKIWKIFGRETQAGRLLYQLYKNAEPAADIVYPVPKSVKDLRGNPNFRVLTPMSSSSAAAAASRQRNRPQVKVAVPRVGRHAVRAEAASGFASRRLKKGNFLSGDEPRGKRSIGQIAKETEKRRQQILDEALVRGVSAAAMGLQRDREKALLLQKLPYSACSLLPEAARLPTLSARDRAVFFAEKTAADRAALYSASPPPTHRDRKNSPNDSDSRNSSSSQTVRGRGMSKTSLGGVCSSRNKMMAAMGYGTVNPCEQTLLPYVAAARQKYKKQNVVDPETGMTEEQKSLFVQILKELQLRKRRLEDIQRLLPDHVLAAAVGVDEPKRPTSSSGINSKGSDCTSSSPRIRPDSSSRGKIILHSSADTFKGENTLLSTCFSADTAKSRLAQRTILQHLQEETKLKREVEERMKDLETLISISDAQQLAARRK